MPYGARQLAAPPLLRVLRLVCHAVLLFWLIQYGSSSRQSPLSRNQKKPPTCSVFDKNPGECFCHENAHGIRYASLLSTDIDQYNHALKDIPTCFQNHTFHLVGGAAVREIYEATVEQLNITSSRNLADPSRSDHSVKNVDDFINISSLPIFDTLESSRTSDLTLSPTASGDRQNVTIIGWVYRSGSSQIPQETPYPAGNTILTTMNQILLGNESNKTSLRRLGKLLDDVAITDLLVLVDTPTEQPEMSKNRGKVVSSILISKVSKAIGEEYRFQVFVDNNQTAANNLVSEREDGSLSESKSYFLRPVDFLNILCVEKTDSQGDMLCTARNFVLRWYFVLGLITSIVAFDVLDIYISGSRIILEEVRCFNLFVRTLSYCLVADDTSLFEKHPKTVDVKMFVLFTVATFVVTARCWTRIPTSNRTNTIGQDTRYLTLTRLQTEEWKGWMQAVILIYHFFGLSKVLWVYQIVRVLVAAYLFLTGYSHTAYFLKTKDFSLRRVAQVLIRLNLLSCVLAFVMNKTWDFYYFPGLSSFWFLIVFITLRSAKSAIERADYASTITILIVSCFVVQTMLRTDLGILMWSRLLDIIHSIGGPLINKHEFFFRIKLDSCVPYIGASVAILSAKANADPDASLSRVVRRSKGLCQTHSLSTSSLSASIVVLFFWSFRSFEDKVTSNEWHTYFSAIPILAYLVFRNSSVNRTHTFNQIFSGLGLISLETYILQSHLWLASNNKQLLYLALFDRFPFTNAQRLYGWLDQIIVTSLFLIISFSTATTTKFLVYWLTVGSMRRLGGFICVCWMLNIFWESFN